MKTTKEQLADWIEAGLNHGHWAPIGRYLLSRDPELGVVSGDVLGAAMIGKYGIKEALRLADKGDMKKVAESLGISVDYALFLQQYCFVMSRYAIINDEEIMRLVAKRLRAALIVPDLG